MLDASSRLTVADEIVAALVPARPLMDIYSAPSPIRAAGRTYLVYELHLTNIAQVEMCLVSVQVFDRAQPDRFLVTISDSLLADWVVQPGRPRNAGANLCVGPNGRAVLLLNLALDDPAQLPDELGHQVIGAYQVGATESVLVSRGGFVQVAKRAPLCLGPPVGEGCWIVLNAFDAGKYGHRGAICAHPLHGRAVEPQRYAIDLIQIDRRGKTYRGTGEMNRDAYCYGSKVLAVSAGVIVTAQDRIPDNKPGCRPRGAGPDKAGNHVILDMLNGHYAVYAHLRHSSLRVQEGDRVRRGDVLGSIGNSGCSDSPHLHFYVADANALCAESLPYVFKRFELLGTCSFDRLLSDDVSWEPGLPSLRRHEMPLEEYVIRF